MTMRTRNIWMVLAMLTAVFCLAPFAQQIIKGLIFLVIGGFFVLVCAGLITAASIYGLSLLEIHRNKREVKEAKEVEWSNPELTYDGGIPQSIQLFVPRDLAKVISMEEFLNRPTDGHIH